MHFPVFARLPVSNPAKSGGLWRMAEPAPLGGEGMTKGRRNEKEILVPSPLAL
jgi:hypothetical protein